MDPEQLRPVEALKLLDRENKERFNRENALAATLVHLSMNGYIEPEQTGDGFEPTDKDPSSLRDYERDLLDAIEGEDDPRDMVNAVYRFDFEKLFLENGLLEAVEKQKEFLIFDWTKTVHEETDAYQEAIDYLQQKRDEIAKADEIDEHLFALGYAYPSEDFEDGFLEQAEDIVDDLEAAMDSGSTAAIAAATAASAASCSAAASSAAACGSAGACGGAGAC